MRSTPAATPERDPSDTLFRVRDTVYERSVIDPLDPDTQDWAHPGVCITPDGRFLWAAPDGRTIRTAGTSGAIDLFTTATTECHGLASDSVGGVWIADNGCKETSGGQKTTSSRRVGRVLRVNMAGEETCQLDDPSGRKSWRPTGVALHSFGAGSDGRLWVADGYGDHLIHCFSADGDLLWTSDGSDSGVRFQTPHGLVIDDHQTPPRLLVADRGNGRVIAFSVDGDFCGVLCDEHLTSPSGLAIDAGLVWVTELYGAVKVLDPRGRMIAAWGSASRPDEPGWPNRIVEGAITGPDPKASLFRAPHGIAVNHAGSVVVTEWMVGGRVSHYRRRTNELLMSLWPLPDPR